MAALLGRAAPRKAPPNWPLPRDTPLWLRISSGPGPAALAATASGCPATSDKDSRAAGRGGAQSQEVGEAAAPAKALAEEPAAAAAAAPGAEAPAADAAPAAAAAEPQAAAAAARPGAGGPSEEVLALSCIEGPMLFSLDREVDAVLELFGDRASVSLVDDADWTKFPQVGAALQQISSRDECLSAAVCAKSGLRGFGVSMCTRTRFTSARAALVITLALRPGGIGVLAPYPQLADLALRAHRLKWAPLRTAAAARVAGATAALRRFCRKWLCSWRARRWMRFESACEGSATHWAQRTIDERGNPAWEGFCVCCKRPLTVSFVDGPGTVRKRRKADRYAYACALWGTNPEHALGAMVLGHSLRRTGTPHDLVLLHTTDVPLGARELLRSAGWRLCVVDYVSASENLFSNPHNRFAGTFTKLRVFSLVEYTKVILMDSDILVRENIDSLFHLRAPAAMHRGIACGYAHGERINGRHFFGGCRPGFDANSQFWSSSAAGNFSTVRGPWSWGQSGGINAGVMLFEPDLETLKLCLSEVTEGSHPEHIPGSGPEQDYLSRFYAGEWSHINVAFNFQLHQMYFMVPWLDGDLAADRKEFLLRPELIKAFHYSADPKPWARLFSASLSSLDDPAWVKEVQGKFSGYRAWILKDPEYKYLDSCGEDEPEVPKWAVEATDSLVARSLREWEETYRDLARQLDKPALAEDVVAAHAVSWAPAAPAAAEAADPATSQEASQSSSAAGGGGSSGESSWRATGWPSRGNSVWALLWEQLPADQRSAAESLGWSSELWDHTTTWPLPHGILWDDMPAKVQSALETLGETRSSWDVWEARK